MAKVQVTPVPQSQSEKSLTRCRKITRTSILFYPPSSSGSPGRSCSVHFSIPAPLKPLLSPACLGSYFQFDLRFPENYIECLLCICHRALCLKSRRRMLASPGLIDRTFDKPIELSTNWEKDVTAGAVKARVEVECTQGGNCGSQRCATSEERTCGA